MELCPRASGQPQLILRGWAATLSRKRRIIQQTVSISHSADFAIAMVILVGMDQSQTQNEVP
jgi:phosphopantetheinyl transferase (holo-ACP synthase)